MHIINIEQNIKTSRGTKHKRLLKYRENTENKLSVTGEVWVREWAKWVRGIKEDTCWDEQWVLYTRDQSLESTPEIIVALCANQLGCKLKNKLKKK